MLEAEVVGPGSIPCSVQDKVFTAGLSSAWCEQRSNSSQKTLQNGRSKITVQPAFRQLQTVCEGFVRFQGFQLIAVQAEAAWRRAAASFALTRQAQLRRSNTRKTTSCFRLLMSLDSQKTFQQNHTVFKRSSAALPTEVACNYRDQLVRKCCENLTQRMQAKALFCFGRDMF